MRLDWLEDILAVAKTGSFNEAAEQRNLTPSAFSRRVQSIEDHIGVRLFDRSRKPVQLRPGVAEQRDRIERLAAELRNLMAELRRGDRTAGNMIVLASQHALTTAMTPQLVKRIHDRHAEIYLRLRSANADECFAMLLSRQADIALVYRLVGTEHPFAADYIESMAIGTDSLVPVFARAKLDDLRGTMGRGMLPVIAYPRDVFLGGIIERHVYPRVAEEYRIVPVAETALTLASQELALAGLGVAWLPKSLVSGKVAAERLADLSDILPAQGLEVTAVRLGIRRRPAEEAVWAILRDQTAE